MSKMIGARVSDEQHLTLLSLAFEAKMTVSDFIIYKLFGQAASQAQDTPGEPLKEYAEKSEVKLDAGLYGFTQAQIDKTLNGQSTKSAKGYTLINEGRRSSALPYPYKIYRTSDRLAAAKEVASILQQQLFEKT